MGRLKINKVIFAVLFAVLIIFVIACQQKTSNQANMQKNPAQTSQYQQADISNSLNGASTVDNDLNVEDNSSETDSGLDDAQNI